MTLHTPLGVRGRYVVNAFGITVMDALDIETAERVVACVNACEGISTRILTIVTELSPGREARLMRLSGAASVAAIQEGEI